MGTQVRGGSACKGLLRGGYKGKMPFRPETGVGAKNALVTEDPCPPLNLVIMGGPGCGKGTICRAIVEKFGVVHVSVGDILRKRQNDGSDIGEQVQLLCICVCCEVWWSS